MTGNSDTFDARRQDYLDRGAFAQTADDLPELKRMQTQGSIPGAMSSTDNLIQYPPSYPPQYVSQSSSYSGAPSSRRPSDYGQSRQQSDFSQTSTPYENEKYFQGVDLTAQPQYDTNSGRPSLDSRSGTPPHQYQQNSYSPRQYQNQSQQLSPQQSPPSSRLSPSSTPRSRNQDPRRGQTPPPSMPVQAPQPQQLNRQSFDFGFDISSRQFTGGNLW